MFGAREWGTRLFIQYVGRHHTSSSIGRFIGKMGDWGGSGLIRARKLLTKGQDRFDRIRHTHQQNYYSIERTDVMNK